MSQAIPTNQNLNLESGRIGSLDAIRALALLCLVPMVVQSYALVAASGESLSSSPLTGADGVIWILLQIFCADIGFILLTIAFGAGMKLHALKQSMQAKKATDQQRRRLTALIAVSLFFIFILGADTTLLALSLVGLLAGPFIEWEARKQLIVGTVFVIGGAIVFATLAELMSAWAPAVMIDYGLGDMKSPVTTSPDLLALAQSGWSGQFLSRLRPSVLLVNSIITFQLMIQGIGLVLLAAVAAERGILTGGLPASRYVMNIAVGLGIGVPLSLLGILTAVSQAWEPPFLMGFGGLLKGFGSLLLSAAFVSLLTLIFKRRWLTRTRRMLTRLGRSTLTWSILGLIFVSFYYHGYGLGHVGTGDRISMMQFVATILFVVCGLSYFWLKYFHYGPFEWALRYWANETRPPLARLDKIFAP